MKMLRDRRLTVLKHWVAKTAKSAKGLFVPVSGGSDSALALYLLSQVYPEKTTAIFVGENLRAEEWFKKTSNGNLLRYPHDPKWKYPEVERYAIFQKMAITENRWIAGTRNRTEQALGNFSFASRVATYLPLIGVWKTDVMELCRLIAAPKEVMDSSRRADPDCGRPPELAEISLEYIDVFLKIKEGLLKKTALNILSEKQKQYLEKVYNQNQFRKHLPVMGPIIK